MAVKIGSARYDEDHQLVNGIAGDQTGQEVATENWYLHNLGWVVLRAKDPVKAEKIAQDMEYACDNPNIGYDQHQNDTLLWLQGLLIMIAAKSRHLVKQTAVALCGFVCFMQE